MSTPATAEEKTKKKNDVKARGLLLMALPNEHQLTFSQYPDAKSMFAAIKTRFEKIVSRLAILGVMIAQEDLNIKFLSSLPPEWNTHVVGWMNKPEIETMSIDDLYNNFKIVEQKIKKTVGTSSGVQNLAFMTAPSSSSTNDANTASSQVSAASLSVNTAESIKQIHEDDLEAMDLKWQLSLLSVRAKKYYQKTGKNIFINGNDIAGYDKSSGGFQLFISLGHFLPVSARAPRRQSSFDWSDMAEEQVQTNMALMAFLDSEVYTDKTCSKNCLKNYESLKKQYDDLVTKQHETKFKAITYKRGLDTVEAQLVTYRKNEVLFNEEVAVPKREVGIKQYEINTLKTEFEKVKQEKDAIDFKIEKFGKASKDLDQLLGSQITDKSKKEPEFKGYGLENNKKESNIVCENESDKSKENSAKSLVKEQVSQVKSSFVKGCESNTSKSVNEVEPKKVRKNDGAPIIEDWVSDDEEEDEPKPKSEKKIVIPTAAKKESVKPEKLVKKSVRLVNIAHPKTTVYSAKSKTHFSKQLQSTAKRPFYKQTTSTRRSLHKAKRHYYTRRYNAVNTAKSYTGQVNAVKVKRVNAVKSSTYWVWRPTKSNGASLTFKELGLKFEITSKQSNDPPLSRGYTLGSGEDNMKLIGIDGIDRILYTTATAKVQTVNRVRQLQALIDKKRVIFMESSIRRDLHLADAEVTDCLPTATIFEELARMGYEKPSQKLTFYKAFFSPQWKYFIHTITQCLSAKSTTWNEFSSSMASLIICLATNQKFNLSKYIFDVMVKHLDGGVKFLMYLLFLQVFINKKLGTMSTHKKIFVNPFHTKKVFANMKKAGKDFSRRITSLFDTMMVKASEEVGEDSDHPTDSTQIPILD
ncbi:hypothetical protein Tco_0819885 [Tanacetum coccineum]|uniref:Uncharacterized protein n=1 Tax=Tanacetum coccineum TaxID=301880 RepID=A0ABQ5A7U9_9ASTR